MFVVSNLKMPANCEECPLDPSACTLWEDMTPLNDLTKITPRRHPNCPLKPVQGLFNSVDDVYIEVRELDI